jgi:hypothetical protein
VIRDRRVVDGKCEEAFWHLTTKDQYGDRLFDARRSERLPWCRPTITNSTDAQVTAWKYEEGRSRVRLYLWLEKWDYVIVLELRPRRLFLVTAYHVDGDSTRRSLRRKLQNQQP